MQGRGNCESDPERAPLPAPLARGILEAAVREVLERNATEREARKVSSPRSKSENLLIACDHAATDAVDIVDRLLNPAYRDAWQDLFLE